jgi:SAM-dependent methyltransferase
MMEAVDKSMATQANTPSYSKWLFEGIQWRLRNWRPVMEQRIDRLLGRQPIQWARVVMDRETQSFVESLPLQEMDALEISGDKWQRLPFRAYQNVHYPEFDVCEDVLGKAAFDFIVAEQVLEHILWPYRAVRNIHAMLRPGGWFLVTTPFLLRLHPMPHDCCRWTEEGMRYLLAEAGFDLKCIRTGSWGSRACVKANFHHWVKWTPWLHSLKNEQAYPVVVWAFAQK